MDLANNAPYEESRGTKALDFVTSLVNDGIIRHGYAPNTNSVHEHKLSAANLFRMFYNILHPLVHNNHPSDPLVTPVDDITRSIAYDALENTFAVLYHKGTREHHTLVRTLGKARDVVLYSFPIFVALLINSIGPVKFNEVPAGGFHVPYLLFDDVLALKPRSYTPSHIAMFTDKVRRSSSYALLGVDTAMRPESSPWWTFHTKAEPRSNKTPTYTLWSPVQWYYCDHVLKLGVLYAKSPVINSFGVGIVSATPYCAVNDPPRADEFPSYMVNMPYLNRSHPAYYSTWQRAPEYDKIGSASHRLQAPSTSSHNSSAGAAEPPGNTNSDKTTAQPGIRKRKLPDDVTQVEKGAVQHRIIYFYFDHQVVQGITDTDLWNWSPKLNAL